MAPNDDKIRKKALLSMEELCAKSEKCKQDIRNKLFLQKLNPSDIEWIIENLEAEKFIDEQRYTNFYVRDKFRFNKWGKIKIRYNLSSKRIPEDIIREALETIDEDQYFKTLLDELSKKNSSLKDRDTNYKKAALFRFGAQKGFEGELIYKAIELLLS
jgi:regulatory protein